MTMTDEVLFAVALVFFSSMSYLLGLMGGDLRGRLAMLRDLFERPKP